jgi:ABC-type Fe3+-siderophore transport system permease subunit
MSSPDSNINFSFEYVVSVVVILIVCNLLVKSNPQMNTIIVLIVGLLVGYLTLLIMNTLFPALNAFGVNIYQYLYTTAIGNFNDTGYINLWPPILAILIIFIVLLYNRQLG